MRSRLKRLERVGIYANAKDILHLANVDGVLVGGASLKADEFMQIAEASAG